jgi:hypothetical protein
VRYIFLYYNSRLSKDNMIYIHSRTT